MKLLLILAMTIFVVSASETHEAYNQRLLEHIAKYKAQEKEKEFQAAKESGQWTGICSPEYINIVSNCGVNGNNANSVNEAKEGANPTDCTVSGTMLGLTINRCHWGPNQQMCGLKGQCCYAGQAEDDKCTMTPPPPTHTAVSPTPLIPVEEETTQLVGLAANSTATAPATIGLF